MTGRLDAVRRLRAEHPDWGNRRIGTELGIGKDAALRLLNKLKLEDAQRRGQSLVTIPTSEVQIEPQTAAEYAERIAATWRKSVEAILETGLWIARAKEALEHGEFGAMIANDLPFGARKAQILMQIAMDERLANAKHISLLPPHWGTLYELHKLDDERFYAKIEDGTIRPDMDRRDIITERKQQTRQTREKVLGGILHALPDKRYGVILADPEWRFEPWSRNSGMDRAADNHYPTSCTDVIAARDVPGIAADDCVLFLCATNPMLPHALLVMAAWGFDYRSEFVWNKDRIGTGYWNRNKHEHLLIGVRGNPPAPAMGTQWDSVIDAPIGRHSAKPEAFYEMIEAYFPSLPKIELNRRGPPRPGWDAWGNEAEAPHDSETGEILENESSRGSDADRYVADRNPESAARSDSRSDPEGGSENTRERPMREPPKRDRSPHRPVVGVTAGETAPNSETEAQRDTTDRPPSLASHGEEPAASAQASCSHDAGEGQRPNERAALPTNSETDEMGIPTFLRRSTEAA